MRKIRFYELARKAVKGHNIIGVDLINSIVLAIEQAIDEHNDGVPSFPTIPRRCRGMRRCAQLLAEQPMTPSTLATTIGTHRSVTWYYLRRLVRMGIVEKVPGQNGVYVLAGSR